jgi:hypothetical protein
MPQPAGEGGDGADGIRAARLDEEPRFTVERSQRRRQSLDPQRTAADDERVGTV